MSNIEDQREELEALESILMDEFKLLDQDPFEFEIKLNSERDEPEKNFVRAKIILKLPFKYPEEIPEFHIKSSN
jgi:hypothetical protein